MRLVFVSKGGDSLSLALRCQEEGWDVILYIESPKAQEIGEGLVPKLKLPSPISTPKGNIAREGFSLFRRSLKDMDVLVFDMVGFGKPAEALRQEGFCTIGANRFADAIEFDRWYGTMVMRLVGIPTPRTKVFSSYGAAINYVKETPYPLVFKPHENQRTETTYVAQGKEDLVKLLEFYKQTPLRKVRFELQERVEGVEVSCEGWFNGQRFVMPVNITFEKKHFMAGDIGPRTGCAANAVLTFAKPIKLFKEGVAKMEPLLRRTGYVGPIDLNSIVKEDKLYGLEFTPRFGYDAIQTLFEGMQTPLGEWLTGIATMAMEEGEGTPDWFFGVRISIPPYPQDNGQDVEGMPLIGLTDEAMRHFWPGDVKKTKDGLVCAGVDGNLGCVTARGSTLREASRRVYRTLGRLQIPNMQYRIDGDEGIMERYKQLKTWRWLE